MPKFRPPIGVPKSAFFVSGWELLIVPTSSYPPPVLIIPLFNLIDPVDLLDTTLAHTGSSNIYSDIRLEVPMSVCP